jgi:hypothetical protein
MRSRGRKSPWENPWEQKKKARPLDVIELVELLLDLPRLTEWERGFLESIHDQALRRYSFEPSPKQQAIIDRIAREKGGNGPLFDFCSRVRL